MRSPAPVAGLTLRPWRDDDAAALMAVAGDPLLERWTRVRAAGPAEAGRWLRDQQAGWASGARYSFAVVDGTGGLAGQVALKRSGSPAGEAEVGYWTAAYARGRGVAPQAVGSLTGWAFAVFPELRRLVLRHQVDNPGSCRVALKSGYAYELTLPARAPYPRDGHLHVRDRTS